MRFILCLLFRVQKPSEESSPKAGAAEANPATFEDNSPVLHSFESTADAEGGGGKSKSKPAAAAAAGEDAPPTAKRRRLTSAAAAAAAVEEEQQKEGEADQAPPQTEAV